MGVDCARRGTVGCSIYAPSVLVFRNMHKNSCYNNLETFQFGDTVAKPPFGPMRALSALIRQAEWAG
jgi:hypothetical protein